jgi:hypothetical protein
MSLPGFAAEAALYKSGRAYGGCTGPYAPPGVLAAISCSDVCDVQKDICGAVCGFNIGCLAACAAIWLFCKAACSGGGGTGIGGWANPCCPPGEKCCGHCGTTVVNNRHYPFCYGECVGLHEACPKTA